MRFFRTTLAIVGVLAAVTALSACSSTGGMMDNDGAGSSSDANSYDTSFTMMMVPHHQDAIDMAEAILEKDGIDPRVSDLAERIKAAQAPEVELMNGWLDDWGFGTMAGMDHGGGMSAGDMDELAASTGIEASRLFLTQMIEHHSNAVDMANAELRSGQDPAVLELAQNILTSQTAEIDEMNSLLASL